MKINQEEAENIMNMLASSDKENGYMAFKAIDAHDFTEKEDLGYLLYFYKFSKFTINDWVKNTVKAGTTLSNVFDTYGLKDAPVTYSRALTIMVENSVSKESIELFLERHVKDLTNNLSALGYPIDKLDFNLKLKQ